MSALGRHIGSVIGVHDEDTAIFNVGNNPPILCLSLMLGTLIVADSCYDGETI